MSNKAFRQGGKLRINLRARIAGLVSGAEYWIEDIIESVPLNSKLLWVRRDDGERCMVFEHEACNITNTVAMCSCCCFSDDLNVCENCYDFKEFVEYDKNII